ncbi:MAG: hypothetical protein QOD80_601 [Verrucomicrobiota bacterium]
MIDLEKPKPESVGVLTGEAMSEPAGGVDFEVIQDDNGALRCLVHGEKKGVLALRRIGRAINQDKSGLLQTVERFALRQDIERLDRPQAIPATRKWNDAGKIRVAFRDSVLERFGPSKVIR